MSRVYSTMLLAVLWGSCWESRACAQSPGAVKEMRGVVVDGLGKPVGGAEVMLGFRSKQEEKIVRTDAEGRFSLRAPTGGRAAEVIARTEDGSLQGVFLPSIDDEPKREEEIRIVLKPAEKLTVKVLNRLDAPLADAEVGVNVFYSQFHRFYRVRSRTNQEGLASYQVPAGMIGAMIVAFKSGEGLHFKEFHPSVGKDRQPSIPDSFSLKLEGASPLRMRAQDEDGNPLAGVRIYPNVLHESKPTQFRLGGAYLNSFYDLLSVVTDDKGEAIFDWFPTWAKRVEFAGGKAGYTTARFECDLQATPPETTLRLKKLVSVAGKVLLPDGAPAAGVEVQFVSDGYEEDFGYRDTTTDAEGKFQFQAPPDHLCMIGARKERLVAMPVDWIVTERNKPVEDIVLHLEPGRRIYGKVTFGKENKPLAGQTIEVRQEGRDSGKIPELRIPNPKQSNKGLIRIFSRRVKTNERGEFEVYSSAFQHTVILQNPRFYEHFDLTNETEREVNFHLEKPISIPLTGKVKRKENGQPVAGARISIAYDSREANGRSETRSDSEGNFRLDRAPYGGQAFVISDDGKYADFKLLSESQEAIDFDLQPTATLRGRAMNAATGEPLANKELTYGIELKMQDESGETAIQFGNLIRTDKEGYFETGPVAIDVEYVLRILPDNSGWFPTLAKITPKKAEQTDLGELEVNPRR